LCMVEYARVVNGRASIYWTRYDVVHDAVFKTGLCTRMCSVCHYMVSESSVLVVRVDTGIR
jgi:hypothetical protein